MQCLSCTQTLSHSIHLQQALLELGVSGVSSIGCLELFLNTLCLILLHREHCTAQSPTATLILSHHPSCRQNRHQILTYIRFPQADLKHKAIVLQECWIPKAEGDAESGFKRGVVRHTSDSFAHV